VELDPLIPRGGRRRARSGDGLDAALTNSWGPTAGTLPISDRHLTRILQLAALFLFVAAVVMIGLAISAH
jgi:hypothetical protein